MSHKLAAVIGVGQTHHRAKRSDVSMAGLLREAIDRAMTDAQVTFNDIDAIVIGKAPDLFEGVMMPELYLAEALGAPGKPLLRVHTAGSVGGSTAIVAASLVTTLQRHGKTALAWCFFASWLALMPTALAGHSAVSRDHMYPPARADGGL